MCTSIERDSLADLFHLAGDLKRDLFFERDPRRQCEQIGQIFKISV